MFQTGPGLLAPTGLNSDFRSRKDFGDTLPGGNDIISALSLAFSYG